MSRFWSPIVEKLAPYSPGEQPTGSTVIKLNTNENPYGPSPDAIRALQEATDDRLRLYPDPNATGLVRSIASKLNLSTDQVFVGNGSDEILAHAFNAFFRGKGPLVFSDVTYSFYKSYCRLYEIAYREIELQGDFRCDPGAYAGPCGGIVIANPNAPTGLKMELAEIRQILDRNPESVVLVDEAYVDFGADSSVDLIAEYENLVVVQTFSKSRSLAGLRVGFAVAHPGLIEALVRVKNSFNSYPLDRLALVAAQAAWEDADWFEETRQRIVADRERTAGQMRKTGFRVLPSATNFLFASHPNISGERLASELRSDGILVRHFAQNRIRDWIRISIGTSDECDALLASIDEILMTASRR